MSPYTVLRMPNFFQTFLIAPSLYPVSSVFADFIGSSFSFTEIFSFSHSLCFSSPYIYIYFYFRKWNLPDMFPTNWLLYHLLWSTTQGRLTYTNTQINLSFLKAFDQIKSWLTLPAWCSGFVVRSLSLCNPMDCNTPDFPVLHCLPEFAQTRVLWVDDTIQPSCPLSSSSPSAFNLSQHQGLFQWVSSLFTSGGPSIGASVDISPSNEYSGMISFSIDWYDLLAVQWGSQESSPTPQFRSINSLALILLDVPTLISIHDYWKNHSFD